MWQDGSLRNLLCTTPNPHKSDIVGNKSLIMWSFDYNRIEIRSVGIVGFVSSVTRSAELISLGSFSVFHITMPELIRYET